MAKSSNTYAHIHPDFKWNGTTLVQKELLSLAKNYIRSEEEYLQHIGFFLRDWFDHNPLIEVQTSGSTGKPKKIQVKKEYMVNSALATGDFFDLPAKTTALLCLPATYIAGKLMIVRALVLGWEIDSVKPQGNPFKINQKTYDFTAITPFQMNQSLTDLSLTKKILVGGGVVSEQLHKKAQDIPTKIYESYAMTETLTHIAARPVNHFKNSAKKPPFKLLKNVSIKQDNRGCLVISAPKVSDEIIVTNDLVNIINTKEFYLKGRYDNIINSGGIKISPEEVEMELGKFITQRFFVAGIPDENLGEKLVLFIEGEITENNLKTLKKDIEQTNLNKYKKPRQVFMVEAFEETHSGKVKRSATIEKALKNLPK